MTDITVIRGDGDRPCDDIIEPLLATVEAALARGRAELDARSSRQRRVRLTTVYRTGVRLGQLAEVHDALQGQTWRGKIAGITHRLLRETDADGRSRNKLVTDLDIVRHEPAE